MKDFAKKNNFPIKERKGISFTMHGGKVKKYPTTHTHFPSYGRYYLNVQGGGGPGSGPAGKKSK